MATTDIIFDAKTVDTELAQLSSQSFKYQRITLNFSIQAWTHLETEHYKKLEAVCKTYINNRPELHSIGFPENGSYEYDKFKTKIYFANIDAEPEIYVSRRYQQRIDKLFDLAKLIEKNGDLFYQLEYLIRGTPVDDVKKCDLKLIIDNLLYCYKPKRCEEIYEIMYCNRIAFLADTPLAALGFIAQSLCYVHPSYAITIISNKDTAIISFLFVDLCRQVGLEKVLLQLVSKDADCSKYNILEVEEMSTGGVGIVTSKCDVDSAVDAFISSTVWYPLKVNKIFVQECVLERFKRVLTWKSEMQAPGCRGHDLEVSCAVSYRCGVKVFVLEATGESGARVVALEAYRTVRELLVLLSALRPLAASLWSSDVAESLEIAHGLSSTIVWVNDFADFRGPPRVSQAFYSIVDVHFSTRTIKCSPELDTLETLRMSWLQLSAEERKALIAQHAMGDFHMKLCAKYNFEDNLVRVLGNGVVTSTITSALIWQLDYYKTAVNIMDICAILIKGGGLLVKSPFPKSLPALENIIKIKGIPVVTEESSIKESCRSAKVVWKPSYEHKVVWCGQSGRIMEQCLQTNHFK